MFWDKPAKWYNKIGPVRRLTKQGWKHLYHVIHRKRQLYVGRMTSIWLHPHFDYEGIFKWQKTITERPHVANARNSRLYIAFAHLVIYYLWDIFCYCVGAIKGHLKILQNRMFMFISNAMLLQYTIFLFLIKLAF